MEEKTLVEQIREKGITFAQVEAKIRALVAANPKFVYNQSRISEACLYTPDAKQPGCLLGQAFIALGVTFSQRENRESINQLLHDMTTSLVSDDPTIFTSLEVNWLSQVQMNQDAGYNWQKALEYADEESPLR